MASNAPKKFAIANYLFYFVYFILILSLLLFPINNFIHYVIIITATAVLIATIAYSILLRTIFINIYKYYYNKELFIFPIFIGLGIFVIFSTIYQLDLTSRILISLFITVPYLLYLLKNLNSFVKNIP